MANLKENAAWESGIYQLETTDPVVGGVDGISNKQAIQLANRTSYLKGEIESLKSNSNAQLVLKRDISDSYSKTQTAALIAPKLDSAIAEATYLKKTDKIDAYSKTECDATFLKKTDKIDAYTKQESDNKFALKTELQKAIPVGSYLLYSSNTNTPDRFLRCDGSALDKNAYSALFEVIGYTYGKSGDKFLLPNFADGKFMRGTGGNAAAMGTAQGDAIRNIIGKFATRSPSAEDFTSGPFTAEDSTWMNYARSESGGARITMDFSKVVPTANENRPYNMAVVVLIKY